MAIPGVRKAIWRFVSRAPPKILEKIRILIRNSSDSPSEIINRIIYRFRPQHLFVYAMLGAAALVLLWATAPSSSFLSVAGGGALSVNDPDVIVGTDGIGAVVLRSPLLWKGESCLR